LTAVIILIVVKGLAVVSPMLRGWAVAVSKPLSGIIEATAWTFGPFSPITPASINYNRMYNEMTKHCMHHGGSLGHGSSLQADISTDSPSQDLPPLVGGGLLQSLVLCRVPPPQDAEQKEYTPQSDHCPSTAPFMKMHDFPICFTILPIIDAPVFVVYTLMASELLSPSTQFPEGPCSW
jgi:hypothetical protein